MPSHDRKNTSGKRADTTKLIARNRKASHNFELGDRFEAGIALLGAEVKSLRLGKMNVSDAYASPSRGEIILKNLHISPYSAAHDSLDPDRPRRLLLHKREIRILTEAVERQGLTIVPVSFYFKNGKAKVELALARGRKKYDKREKLAKQDSDRQIARATRKDR